MLNKILVVVFALLLLVVVGESSYYVAIQKGINTSAVIKAKNNIVLASTGAPVCKSAQLLAKADTDTQETQQPIIVNIAPAID